MYIIDLPKNFARLRGEDWHLAGNTLSSQGIYGPGTLINTENRVWRYTLNTASLRRDEWPVLRAVLDEARGQFGRIRVRACGVIAKAPETGAVTFDSDVTFDAGVGFAAPTLDGIAVSKRAPVGATRLHVTLPFAEAFAPAVMFSLPNDRLYRVASYADGVATINPPLREAVAVGTPIEFEEPTCLMRFLDDDNSLFRGIGNRAAPAQMDMVEVI